MDHQVPILRFYKALLKLEPIELALIPFTSSPAKLLKLNGKGNLNEGASSDIVLLDENLKIHSVICKGKIMLNNYKPIVFGVFENNK